MSAVQGFKHYMHRFATSEHSSHYVALSFSIGTFINILLGFLPGVSLLLVLPIIFIFEKLSKLAALIALFCWNGLTLIPVYVLSYSLGNTLFGPMPHIEYNNIKQLLSMSGDVILLFLVGNAILGGIIAVASYYLVKALVTWYRRKYAGTSTSS
jgi:uncharacterized protein (DUF2062 family)